MAYTQAQENYCTFEHTSYELGCPACDKVMRADIQKNEEERTPRYFCDNCEKRTDRLYKVGDEGFCEDCFNHAVEQGELAYESWRENGE